MNLYAIRLLCALLSAVLMLTACGTSLFRKAEDTASGTSAASSSVTVSPPETTVDTVPPDTAALSETSGDTSDTAAPSATPAHAFTEVDGCTYIDGVLIANKTYGLPRHYTPDAEASAEVDAALAALFAAAAADGLSLFVFSGYRDYALQEYLYNFYVQRDGAAAADTFSARPGHSEHQTGLAFDINTTAPSFEGSPEALWLSANCHRYGFIIRYPEGKEDITGYMYEPWHIRYVGQALAVDIYASGLCLEEYFGITSVYPS